jgi:flagellar motor switch protein FliM
MPMLGVVFDRLATSLVEGMRVLSRTPTTFAIEGLATGGLFEALTLARGSVGAVLHSPELDCRALLTFDAGFVFSLIQVLLGGDGSDPVDPPDRPFTKIELALVQRVAELTARSLPNALAGVVSATFKVERQEQIVDTSILGRRDLGVVTADIAFQGLGLRGKMTVALPQTALQPIRQKLSRDLSNDATTSDPQWTRQMQDGISSAEIIVKGILEEIPMTLGEVAAIEVGHVLKLQGLGMGRVRLECGEHDLFWCKLDQVDGRYTLEIEEPIIEKNDILEDLIMA